MAFDGFGGVGGHLAQQLEVARRSGTEPAFDSSVGGSSLSVSNLRLLTTMGTVLCSPGVYLTVKVNSISKKKKKNSP